MRPPLFLTVADAARRLALHEQTIRAMIRRGELAAVRLGRLVRVFATAVEARRQSQGGRRPALRGMRDPAARRVTAPSRA